MENRNNLPEWLVEVVESTRNQYDPGKKTDYSATSLLVPPMVYALEKRHQPEEDVTAAMPAFLGTTLHDKLEEKLEGNPRYLIEERLYSDISVPDSPTKKMFTVSGQLDMYDKDLCEVSDHKLSSAFSFQGHKYEYEVQLNIQAWLLRKNGYETKSLKINGFAKEWSFVQTTRSRDYPKSMYIPVQFPLWDDVDVETFITSAIIEKEQALLGQMRQCSPSERWARPDSYAVRKEGRKSALRVFNNRDEAEQLALEKGNGHSVEHREGEDIRCQFYCNVSEYCSFYKEKYGEK